MRQKTIWFNVTRLMRISSGGKPNVIRKYPVTDSSNYSRNRISADILYRANKSSIDLRESEAIKFVRHIVKTHPGKNLGAVAEGGKHYNCARHIVAAMENMFTQPRPYKKEGPFRAI